jgi:D-serine deaminase-like pyridoxal phosphate-dependent protein
MGGPPASAFVEIDEGTRRGMAGRARLAEDRRVWARRIRERQGVILPKRPVIT